MNYDPAYIVEYASRLYAQANRIIVMMTLGGLLIGGVGGLVAGFAFRVNFDLGDMGALLTSGIASIVCAAFGFAIGRERAFMRKFEAQRALCQLQTEINTRPRAAS